LPGVLKLNINRFFSFEIFVRQKQLQRNLTFTTHRYFCQAFHFKMDF
jgi:hypothetical protein